MSLHGTGACGDSKCQNFLKRGEYVEHEKLLLNLTDMKKYFAKPSSKRLSASTVFTLIIIYLKNPVSSAETYI